LKKWPKWKASVQRSFAAVLFAWKEQKRSEMTVKEYQDATKSINEDFFSGSKQMNIKEPPVKSTNSSEPFKGSQITVNAFKAT